MAVIFLILLDQVLKISINMFFKTTEIHIWNNFLGFKVFLNCNHISMFNGYAINFKLSIYILIIINVIMSLFLISLYKYIKFINLKINTVYISLIFFIAASISSLIDKVFWGGSLDYIIFLSYILDLKDIYLIVGFLAITIYTLKNVDFKLKQAQNISFVKDFFLFILKKLRLFKKL